MKKILAMILVVALVLSLTACDLGQLLDNAQRPSDTHFTKPDYTYTKGDDDKGGTATTSTNDNADASGIRPEFKDAMDAYEAFYDEYCDILKQYYANPTDMTLLTKYTELMTKAVEMDEAFAKWESKDLNNEELKYYLEVNNRVMQKMIDVMG